jgi:hypothetical protein
MQAQIAVESKLPASQAADSKLPAPFRPHPQPPRTIANAETLATPQLPAHLATQPKSAGPLGTTQLGMPPGITVPPSSPPAPLQTTDGGGFGGDRDTDPVEVVALHPARANESGVREGRDVLAGWGWSTGSVEALDDDYADDAMRRGRRNLMIAIAGALGVVIVIAAVAFAFSGSKKSDAKSEHRAVTPPSPTAPVASAEPPKVEATAPTPANAEAAKTEPSQPTSVEPPGPGAVVPPRFEAVKPDPEPAKTEPGKTEPGKTEPGKTEPGKTEPGKTEPAKTEPARTVAKGEPLKAEPPKAEPWKAQPAKVEPKPEPAKVEPPKVAVAAKAALKAEPLKVEPRKPEPKKAPEKVAKRPPEKIAKAQPVDPYATTTERPRADPAAAYRAGLQQYAHGDTAGALATFRGSLQSNPGFAPTWRGIGLVYEKMGNKGQARAAFKRYLQLAPTAGDADQIRDRMERLGS